MVLDTSAIVGILLGDPERQRLLAEIDRSPLVAVGAPTLFECAMVVSSRLHCDARPRLIEFLRRAEVETIPFTREHYEVASDAFFRYGKGRHPAALNFGDCLAYAVARLSGLPLLYIGDDFSKTDLTASGG
ncbi:MAG: type II toxin-antitoxin system VapC family toxin [Acidobacteria bacterium]|nr:type II toxin-antitoxin system VapC family toxin [Acidobacteriota bacterium]